MQPLLITPGKDLNSRFGYYKHNDLIGIPYGSKVGSRNGKGFIHVLRPTPELWTMALPHRTQILYLADIAFITSWLDIRRGSRVIEAGRLSFYPLRPFFTTRCDVLRPSCARLDDEIRMNQVYISIILLFHFPFIKVALLHHRPHCS